MSVEVKVRQELVDQVDALRNSDTEARVALRGLHSLYFEAKPTATTEEKAYLFLTGLQFAADSGVPHSEDKVIFAEEAQKHRDKQAQSKEKK